VAELHATEEGCKVLELLKTYHGGDFEVLYKLEADGFMPPELLEAKALGGCSMEEVTRLMTEHPNLDVLGLPPHELRTTAKYLRWFAEEGHEVVVNSSGQVCIAGEGLCVKVGMRYVGCLVAVRFRLDDMSMLIGHIPAVGSNIMQVLEHTRLVDMLGAAGKPGRVAEFVLCGPPSAQAAHDRYEAGVEAARAAYAAEAAAAAGAARAKKATEAEEQPDVGARPPLASLLDFVCSRGCSGDPAHGAASGAAALAAAAALLPGAPPPPLPVALGTWVARLPARANEAARAAAAAAAAAAQARDAAAARERERVAAAQRPVDAALASDGVHLAVRKAIAKRKAEDAFGAAAAAAAATAPGAAAAAAAAVAAAAAAAAIAAQGAVDEARAVVMSNIKAGRTHVAAALLLAGGGAPFVPMQLPAFPPPPPPPPPPPGAPPKYTGVSANKGGWRARRTVWGVPRWMTTRDSAAEAARDADVLHIMTSNDVPNFGRAAYPAELVRLPHAALSASADAAAVARKWTALSAVVAAVASYVPSPPAAPAAAASTADIVAAVAALRQAAPQ
jgi:hypothetical protein